MWENQVKAVTAAGYRFIAYDRRGQGKSVADASGSQPGVAADDLAALLDYLRIERAHLVGTAAGGGVAIDFALSFPRRVHALVIACSLGGVVDEDYRRLGEWLRPAPFSALPPAVIELGPEYRAAHRAEAERWISLAHAARAPGTRSTSQEMKNRITLAAVDAIRMPVLAIAGGADLYSPPAVMRLFVGRIKGARFLTLAEAGHSAYWEQPEAFNSALLTFLRAARSAP
jgi:pimeloyl-ACP methyl ester carboxylesterase